MSRVRRLFVEMVGQQDGRIFYADLAHLVERDLAKVEVAGSSPVIRSTYRVLSNKIWRHSQAVRQRSATPSSPVQFWVAPPYASVAQLVEQGTENPRVVGSIPTGGTTF